MRRHVLATMLVVSSAAAVLPATALAGGSSFGGSSAGMSSGSRSNYANQSSSSVGPRVERSNTWGIGSLRVQKDFKGAGLVSKDGSKVRGMFNMNQKTDVTHNGVTTSTVANVKVRGYTRSAQALTHVSGAPVDSTTHSIEIADKHEVHVQSATSRSDGNVSGNSYTANADKSHITTYDHNARTGATTRGTSTAFAGGATNTSRIVQHANGNVERVFTAGTADGKVNEVRGSSVNGPSSHTVFQARVDSNTGDKSGRFMRQDGNRIVTQTESLTHAADGSSVHTKSDSTRPAYRAQPTRATAERVNEAESSTASAPMNALPAGSSGAHAEGHEGAVSVKDTLAKAGANATPSKHAAGKEGGLSVKEIYAKAAPGTYAARALDPKSGPQHAASE